MIITIDFETYYDKEYSLSKITTEEYVRHKQFEVIGGLALELAANKATTTALLEDDAFEDLFGKYYYVQHEAGRALLRSVRVRQGAQIRVALQHASTEPAPPIIYVHPNIIRKLKCGFLLKLHLGNRFSLYTTHNNSVGSAPGYGR